MTGPLRTYTRFAVAPAVCGLVLVLGLAATAGAQADLGNDGVDMDCADFVELNAAQGYFVGDGGSAARNVDNLDADRDGAACESSDQTNEDTGAPDLGNDGVDMDCADFPELNAARGYFVGDGGSPSRNVDNLDADRDGQACEPGDDGDNTEPAPSAAPSAAPSVQPSAAPSAAPTTGGATTLPNTGTGAAAVHRGGGAVPLLGLVGVAALAGGAYALRRRAA